MREISYSQNGEYQMCIRDRYRYADYNLGTYLTEPYYISYGSVRAIAYCLSLIHI